MDQRESDKKPKSYYVDYSKRQNKFSSRGRGYQRGSNNSNNSRYKEVPDINFGQRGFLITSVDEVKSYLEMRSVLEQYFHEIYDDTKEVEIGKEVSAEDELETELKALRVRRPFKQVKTHCRNSIFINIVPEFSNVDPVLIVDKFFNHLAETREIRTTNTNRVLPIIDTFRISASCAKESVIKFLEDHSVETGQKNFFIEFQTRGNYKLESEDKQKIIESVAETITELKPEWKVNRGDADYIFILVALRNVCCLSVVKEYLQRSKYNVIEFCKDFPINNESAADQTIPGPDIKSEQ